MDPVTTEEDGSHLHHVLCRENSGSLLFPDQGDRYRFSQALERHLVDCSCRVQGFCFELPFIHLLVDTDGEGLDCLIARMCKDLQALHGARPGRGSDRIDLRWSVEAIRPTEQALLILRYIHRSPVIRQVTRRPEDFRWSSHRAYLGVDFVPWLTTAPVLSLFGPPGDPSALRHYRDFMRTPTTAGGHWAPGIGWQPAMAWGEAGGAP